MIFLTAALVGALFTKRTSSLRVLIAILAIHALFWVIRTGHLGSELVWNT